MSFLSCLINLLHPCWLKVLIKKLPFHNRDTLSIPSIPDEKKIKSWPNFFSCGISCLTQKYIGFSFMLTVIFLSLSFSASAVFYRSEETTGSGLESHSQLLPAARGGNQHWSVVRAQTQTTAKIQTQPGLPPVFISLPVPICLSVLTFSTLQVSVPLYPPYGHGCLSEGRGKSAALIET